MSEPLITALMVNTQTGEILSTQAFSTEPLLWNAQEQCPENRMLLRYDEVDPNLMRCDMRTLAVVPRPRLDVPDPLRLKVGEVHSLDLQGPFRVLFDGELLQSDGPLLELESNTPDEYEIVVLSFPHQAQTIRVIVE